MGRGPAAAGPLVVGPVGRTRPTRSPDGLAGLDLTAAVPTGSTTSCRGPALGIARSLRPGADRVAGVSGRRISRRSAGRRRVSGSPGRGLSRPTAPARHRGSPVELHRVGRRHDRREVVGGVHQPLLRRTAETRRQHPQRLRVRTRPPARGADKEGCRWTGCPDCDRATTATTLPAACGTLRSTGGRRSSPAAPAQPTWPRPSDLARPMASRWPCAAVGTASPATRSATAD
jgi:hypothetical protein